MPRKQLTIAKAKYLATIGELDKDGKGIRSVTLANKLGVSRPSAHAMLQKLSDLGYIEKEHYGIIYLTEKGRESAQKCIAFFEK